MGFQIRFNFNISINTLYMKSSAFGCPLCIWKCCRVHEYDYIRTSAADACSVQDVDYASLFIPNCLILRMFTNTRFDSSV